jgi:uncharacterized protein (TIGR02145 family)
MKSIFFTLMTILFVSQGCQKESDEISPASGKITDIDGHSYQTVRIGEQSWMQQNLKVTHYRNGDPIPMITVDSIWAKTNEGAYCYAYNDSLFQFNDPEFGVLYNFYAVTDARELCPAGWHVPSLEDYDQLISFLGGNEIAGGKLKINKPWSDHNFGATNSSRFSAMMAGSREDDGSFWAEGAYFWTTTTANDQTGYYLYLSIRINAQTSWRSNTSGLSVRCLKD